MSRLRGFALALLLGIFAASLAAGWLVPSASDEQYRDAPNAQPSRRYPLGTDDLGRDRFARLLHGTRISLLVAPAAALLCTLIAALVGGVAGYCGGWLDWVLTRISDLFVALPWFFLFLTVRAMLPLNVAPMMSLILTFVLMGVLSWASAARVVRAGMRSLRNSDFVIQARASGAPPARIVLLHVLPNLKPILFAQFWLAVPVFILTEAGLGLLGLGVAEPLPSWGNLMRELESADLVLSAPWTLAPVALLVVVMSCFQVLVRVEDAHT